MNPDPHDSNCELSLVKATHLNEARLFERDLLDSTESLNTSKE